MSKPTIQYFQIQNTSCMVADSRSTNKTLDHAVMHSHENTTFLSNPFLSILGKQHLTLSTHSKAKIEREVKQ